MTNISTERLEEHCCFICEAPFKEGEMVLIDVTEGLGQEEGAAGLAERLSDWRARGVSGEDADAAASALLSQASQIEALRKERDEADNALVDKYRDHKTGHFSFPGDVAAIVRRLDAAETKLAEAVEQAFRDGLAYGTNVRNADPDLAWGHSRAKAFLDANGGGHEGA